MPDDLSKRLARLERANKIYLAALALAVFALVLMDPVQAQTAAQDLRVRSLIVEDAQGQARIMLGSPIPDRNQKGNPRTGMIVNDAAGVERFAIALDNAQSMVLGLDAPRGKGDDRNRERITIVADGNGGSHIRFMDRRTLIPARMYLDNSNHVWLELSDIENDVTTRRRIGYSGDERVQEAR